MGKRSTVVAVVALALLLSGIVLAVVRLYRTTPGEVSTTAPALAGWSVLKAIPSDANAVMVFDGSSKAARLMADSTGFVQGQQPRERYRLPSPWLKYRETTGTPSRRMYSHMSTSVQSSRGWMRTWVPGAKSVLYCPQNSGG